MQGQKWSGTICVCHKNDEVNGARSGVVCGVCNECWIRSGDIKNIVRDKVSGV